MVAWEEGPASGARHDVWVKSFNALGSTVRTFLANSATEGEQRNPAVAVDGSGNVVVAWQDDRSTVGCSAIEVVGRAFNADGSARPAPVGSKMLAPSCEDAPIVASTGGFILNADYNGSQQLPALGVDGQGRAVSAWRDAMHARPATADYPSPDLLVQIRNFFY